MFLLRCFNQYSMLSRLFRRKEKTIKPGAITMVKKAYLPKFPTVSRTSLLTVEEIVGGNASVIFMNDKGTRVHKEVLPLEVLVKVD